MTISSDSRRNCRVSHFRQLPKKQPGKCLKIIEIERTSGTPYEIDKFQNKLLEATLKKYTIVFLKQTAGGILKVFTAGILKGILKKNWRFTVEEIDGRMSK